MADPMVPKLPPLPPEDPGVKMGFGGDPPLLLPPEEPLDAGRCC